MQDSFARDSSDPTLVDQHVIQKICCLSLLLLKHYHSRRLHFLPALAV